MDGEASPTPGPPPVPATPVPAPRIPVPVERALVGGEVPEDVVARLVAHLRDDGPDVPTAPWRRPAVGAALGGVAVLALLLVAMTVAGVLL